MAAEFKKTARQIEALALVNYHLMTMLFGGSRSGKSLILVRNVFLRAMKKQSKHLMIRFRYNHARTHLGHETVPYVLANCFPGVDIQENKADGYWTVPVTGKKGETSTVWLGGTDDMDRMEKLLGSEYSTIYLNECSQIPWDAVPMLLTRLAETSGLELRMYFDCNPPGKKHWTNLLFHEGIMPNKEKHDWDVVSLRMNPIHNEENLPAIYLKFLNGLPKRQRQRFLEGLYLTDVEGALWTDMMVNQAKLRKPAALKKTVVAVDPSVTNNPGSDECGIVVVSKEDTRNPGAVVHADLSGKFSTKVWAQRVVNAYHEFEANEIVAEVNNGGDLVKDALNNIDPYIKVKLVRAAKGKFARAEPVAMLYDEGQEKVSHLGDFPELESELTEWVAANTKCSPNRLDALVWGLSHLIIGKKRARIQVG